MTGAAVPIMTGDKAPARPPARLIVAFAVGALALIFGGAVLYRYQALSQRNDAREALTAVSRLKVDQISGWREDRLSDAAVLQDSNSAGDLMRYLSAPTPAGKLALRSSLLAWQQHKGYADVAVTDPRGNVVFSLSGASGRLPRDEAAAIQQAFSLHAPVLTDLHREPASSPHVSAVAPLFAAARNMQGMPHTPVGAVILYCDATVALYPLVISWPNASRTAETVLVRRDGDAMLFLNDARYNPHSAFAVRVPLTRRDVPSVMAGDGKTGFVQGVDYLGVPVFADIRKIPGTTWFAITKVATDEAMASWHAASVQIACLLAGLLAAVSALFFALTQVRAKTQYQLLLEAGTARITSDARLAALVDGSYDAIVATTLDGTVTAWNPAAGQLFGYTAADMVGQPIARLARPGCGAEEDEILARVRRGERIEPSDALRLTKDGRLIDVSLSVSPIKDASGRIVGTSRIEHDITEPKRVRRDLDRLRWMLAPPARADSLELPAQAPVCDMVRCNTAGLILDAAGELLLSEIAADFYALMGTCFAVHEANGDLAYSVLVSDWCRFLDATTSRHCASSGDCKPQASGQWLCHQSPGRESFAETMARGEPLEFECTGGLHLYAVPIHAGGEVVGTMSLGYGDPPSDLAQLAQLAGQFGVSAAELERHAAAYETRPPFIVELAKQRLAGSARLLGEIVQRRRGEVLLLEARDDLARSNRELEQFAYVASHDLQEPLRMVASYTQLLAHRYGDKLDQDAREFIAYAVDGATRMKQLIEDLLAYSRMTSRARPDSVVDTSNSLALALRNLDAAIREAGAEVECSHLPAVLADAGQLVQLFQNLVGNAIKFRTPDVPPRVQIEARRAPDDPRQWLFRVADNGIGIDPKYFARVFMVFQRLHTRQEYPGTGIGLALCRRIVERYKGRIWIESEPGKGTAFLFTLPEVGPEKRET
jgi:PAS domain S-box-containing protein